MIGMNWAKAERHVNAAVKITCIQEIGFDGFWIHRVFTLPSRPPRAWGIVVQQPKQPDSIAPRTKCREILLVFGESDVTSHRARLNSSDRKQSWLL
jgi:hypothetical protein